MYSRLIFFLTLAGFASSVSIRIADPLLPAVAASFDTSIPSAAHAITAFALAYGAFQLIYGPIGDRVGKLQMIRWACLASTLTALGTALAPSQTLLISFRFLNGATAGAIVPLSLALIGDLIPYESRQTVLARYLGGSLVGLVSGHFIGGLLTDLISWRAAFGFLAASFIFAGVLLWREAVRNPINADAPKVHQRAMLKGYGAVFQSRWACFILVLVLVEGAAVFGALAFVPTYLHLQFGLSLSISGGVLALFGIGGVIYAVLARQLIHRLGQRGLVSGGAVLLATAFSALLLAHDSWVPTVPAMVALGLGFYMLHNTLQTHATQMAPKVRGTAVSLFATFLFFGNAAGVAGAAMLAQQENFRLLFALSGVTLTLLAIGFGFTLAAKSRTEQQAPPDCSPELSQSVGGDTSARRIKASYVNPPGCSRKCPRG